MTDHRTISLRELAENTTLPEKPVDAAGRPVSWVIATGEPGFYYEGQFYEVDEAFIGAKVEQYEAFGEARGYTAPVIVAHDEANTRGRREGDVLQLASWAGPNGREYLLAACAWANANIPAEIESGQVKYFSPGFKTITDETGQDWPGVLAELSITAAPHQKSLFPQTHIAAKEADTVANETPETPETVEAPEAPETPEDAPLGEDEDEEVTMADLMQAVKDLDKRVSAMEHPPEDDEDDAEEEEVEMAETPEDRADFDAALKPLLGRTIKLSEDAADTLYTLARKDADAVASLLSKATKADRRRKSWAERLGVSANLSEAAPTDEEAPDKHALLREAKAAHPGDAKAAKAAYVAACKAHGLL